MTVSGTTSRISLVACTLWLATIPAHAVDLNSQDLIPAPAGTDAILAYFTYATRDSFTPTGGGEIKQGTGLDSFVSIFRYVHYMDVGGFTVAPQVLMPYGRLYNGSLGGARLDSASGLGDPHSGRPGLAGEQLQHHLRPRALPVRPCRFLRCRAHAQRR